ncbi:Protein of unknown function (DUF3558) [Prauserella aidingensis]|uniref:DUF3558 family protein n=1 Tax=Prauserella aidingensis TaxID=387890 RepID=UPI0020A4B069|nr:DUF3558 family protein [Prauserella aidingensis]MCP2256050.1 Protein of unknown function (DUF3558) [Prauserella aidingensis]
MKINRAVLAVSLGVLVGVSACSSSEGGEATTEPPASAQPSMSAPSSSVASNPEGSLAGTEPCSLLSKSDVSKYGEQIEGPIRENIGSSRGCRFKKPFQSEPRGSFVLGVGIRDEQGVKDAVDQGYGIQKTEADGRTFARIPGADACIVAIGVTETSRVDVSITTAAGTEKACQVASEVSDVVAARLPEG